MLANSTKPLLDVSLQKLCLPLRSWRGRHRRCISSFGQTCWRAAVEDLYETGQHRLHLIDLPLLARNYLTAKFLDFRILDGRPFTHENSSRMMRDHRR